MEEYTRCAWVNLKNPAYVSYHDTEWGKVHYDDAYMYELLVLESFQAGLSWECILNKREAFREAFDGFDYHKIAGYEEEKLQQLAENTSIVRNKLKIKAAVNNAKIFIKIQEEYGTFSDYIWHFTKGRQLLNPEGEIRATSQLSDTVSADLKKRGMKFVGSTILYSCLQAVGVINDHGPDCDFGAGWLSEDTKAAKHAAHGESAGCSGRCRVCDPAYAKVISPTKLYELLSGIWCADTCAPRMRDQWSPANKTRGQCSITAFLVQDIFGGHVYGIPLGDGSVHCFNEIGGCRFDLTIEQFGDRAAELDYRDQPEQLREVHFAKDEKKQRYEYLKKCLLERLNQ